MKMSRMAAAGAAGVLLAAAPVHAQGIPSARVAVTVSAGYGITSRTFSQTTTFELFSEDGSLTSTYTVKRTPLFEAAATARLWRHLGAGIAFSSMRQTRGAQITAQIPDPFEFDQFHPITGAPSVLHDERAVHAQAAFWFAATRRLDVVVSGGPSFFTAKGDFVTDVTYADPFPYNAPVYQAATLTRSRKTTIGANVGVEAGWRLASHVGLAAVARYSRATADFTSAGGPSVVLGGLHAGGGIRLLF